MPIIAVPLIVLLVGVLLWLVHRNRVDEENTALIKDVLWVERDLAFHLRSTEETLTRLAQDLGGGTLSRKDLVRQANVLASSHPELVRLQLHDGQGKAVLSVPPHDEESVATGLQDPSDSRSLAFALARSLGKPSYSGAYAAPGFGQAFAVYVPVFNGNRFDGMLTGEISLDAMLFHYVPWWVASRYKVEVIDENGAALASTTRIETAERGASHQVRFEPPGQGLAILATHHPSGWDLPRDAIVASIFGLAVISGLSLFSMRAHMRHRLAAEEALKAEHAFRKSMEDSLTVGMRARDFTGRILYVNPAFCRMVGWSADELVGLGPPMPYWLDEDMERTIERHRSVIRGDVSPEGFELRLKRKNDEMLWVLIYEAPLIDAFGKHIGWMGSVVDISDRKRDEEIARQNKDMMQHNARLISMGEMASTLAHELNQPLSAIASYNTGCLNKLASTDYQPEELKKAMVKLGVQAQRAGEIVRRIYDFVRKRERRLTTCSINAVVSESIAFIAADAKRYGVASEVKPWPNNPEVNADRILLQQVLLNLVRNAIEAMGGTPEDRRAVVVTVEVEGGEVVVSVIDRGCGVPESVAAELFQPFFTTKEEGMGMGLNICRSIIEYHQGRLWYEPNPQGGSIFRFTLPMVASA